METTSVPVVYPEAIHTKQGARKGRRQTCIPRVSGKERTVLASSSLVGVKLMPLHVDQCHTYNVLQNPNS